MEGENNQNMLYAYTNRSKWNSLVYNMQLKKPKNPPKAKKPNQNKNNNKKPSCIFLNTFLSLTHNVEIPSLKCVWAGFVAFFFLKNFEKYHVVDNFLNLME